jgi:hypothetical protein
MRGGRKVKTIVRFARRASRYSFNTRSAYHSVGHVSAFGTTRTCTIERYYRFLGIVHSKPQKRSNDNSHYLESWIGQLDGEAQQEPWELSPNEKGWSESHPLSLSVLGAIRLTFIARPGTTIGSYSRNGDDSAIGDSGEQPGERRCKRSGLSSSGCTESGNCVDVPESAAFKPVRGVSDCRRSPNASFATRTPPVVP